MAAKGRFITFEGGDGVGKSTQAARLATTLDAHNIETVRTFEPGGTPFGARVRELFLSEAGAELDARTQALLLNAARQDHLINVIRPALKSGRWVVSDRFSDSTLAYQGIVEGAGLDWTTQLDRLVTDGLKPDLTILLTLDPIDTTGRLAMRNSLSEGGANQPSDRYDRREAPEHRRLEAAFKEVARQEPDRFVILDGGEPEDVLAERIWSEVDTRFGPLTERKGA